MSIPLVQNNEKDSINTSIIAIKKNLERINSILGLVDSGSDIDTSEFVKKSDIVDEVTSGDMQSVTSNAVSEALSYSTTEQDTGAKWIDGKPIYRKVIDYGALPNATIKTVNHNIANIDYVVNINGIAYDGDYFIQIAYTQLTGSDNVAMYMNDTSITLRTGINRSTYTKCYLIIEYTKTTD